MTHWSTAGQVAVGALTLAIAAQICGCTDTPAESTNDDPNAVEGELVTYVADFDDGHSERWYALRQSDGRELRVSFEQPPNVASGTRVRLRGERVGESLRVTSYEATLRQTASALVEGDTPPEIYPAPAQDTYALVLVDLGGGVNVTAAQGQTTMFATGASDKSFANYYSEVSYGKYQISGAILGPFSFSMTSCDTTGMYQAIEPQITGSYNHLIYYFNRSSLCSWGGLGEEGSVSRPAKRTWMNGSLSCVVLMQEPGHNLGLMHANTMNCGTSASFSTTPATSCTITEYGSTLSTMGGGCRQFNAYERWYMQWLSGCNGVRVPASGTFNLVPLETSCPGAIQVLQVPFPATLVVNDPQATTTNVNLKNYYVELRAAGGIFDSYATSRGVTFSGPTVFIYVSDDVRVPGTTTRGGNSVWTELLNLNPASTSFTGLTTAGQSFDDPAGGPTITLRSISATGATIEVTNPNGTGSPTCIDGSALSPPGPTTCGTGGSSGAGGAATGGKATGGSATGGRATGGLGPGGRASGGQKTGGTAPTATGGNAVISGGSPTAGAAGGGDPPGSETGCTCKVGAPNHGALGGAALWGLGLIGWFGRRRRSRASSGC